MKREQLLENLFKAYFDARKNKRNTVNQLRFELNFESNLIALCKEIEDRTYKVSPSICFIVDKPVTREIFAADFRDRVIYHLLFNYINPYFESLFIEDSYSCRKGKGTLYGIKQIAEFIRACSENYIKDCYVLKLDIESYFMNIDRQLLLSKLQSHVIADPNADILYNKDLVDYLLQCILSDDPTKDCIIKGSKADWKGLSNSKSLFKKEINKGLPIGNLASQLFSNIYLHDFDYYIKNELGIQYYGRYIDDFVIVHTDIEYLRSIIPVLSLFLKNNLGLNMHPQKIYLQHYSKGLNFSGAYIKPYRLYVSNRTKQNFRACVRYWEQKLGSSNNSSRFVLNDLRSSINPTLV